MWRCYGNGITGHSESLQKEDLAPQRSDSQNSEIQVKQARREAVLERDVTKCSSRGIGPNRIFHLSLLKPEFLLN